MSSCAPWRESTNNMTIIAFIDLPPPSVLPFPAFLRNKPELYLLVVRIFPIFSMFLVYWLYISYPNDVLLLQELSTSEEGSAILCRRIPNKRNIGRWYFFRCEISTECV